MGSNHQDMTLGHSHVLDALRLFKPQHFCQYGVGGEVQPGAGWSPVIPPNSLMLVPGIGEFASRTHCGSYRMTTLHLPLLWSCFLIASITPRSTMRQAISVASKEIKAISADLISFSWARLSATPTAAATFVWYAWTFTWYPQSATWRLPLARGSSGPTRPHMVWSGTIHVWPLWHPSGIHCLSHFPMHFPMIQIGILGDNIQLLEFAQTLHRPVTGWWCWSFEFGLFVEACCELWGWRLRQWRFPLHLALHPHCWGQLAALCLSGHKTPSFLWLHDWIRSLTLCDFQSVPSFTLTIQTSSYTGPEQLDLGPYSLRLASFLLLFLLRPPWPLHSRFDNFLLFHSSHSFPPKRPPLIPFSVSTSRSIFLRTNRVSFYSIFFYLFKASRA